jgi:hypothetical protein
MKNAISFAFELRFFSKLGLFEKLRKVLKLYAEKHKEFSRGKIPNMER